MKESAAFFNINFGSGSLFFKLQNLYFLAIQLSQSQSQWNDVIIHKLSAEFHEFSLELGKIQSKPLNSTNPK